jgi:hypothetical protein
MCGRKLLNDVCRWDPPKTTPPILQEAVHRQPRMPGHDTGGASLRRRQSGVCRGVAAADIPSKVTAAILNSQVGVVADIDPSSLPTVTDPVSPTSATATPGRRISPRLAFNLEVENEAVIRGDATLLAASITGPARWTCK